MWRGRPVTGITGSHDTDTQIETHVCTHTHTHTLKHTDTDTDRKQWLQEGFQR